MLGGGAGAGGGGSGASGGSGGAPGGGASASLPQCNPVRPGALPVPKEFVALGTPDEAGRLIYSKTELMTYSGLTERWELCCG